MKNQIFIIVTDYFGQAALIDVDDIRMVRKTQQENTSNKSESDGDYWVLIRWSDESSCQGMTIRENPLEVARLICKARACDRKEGTIYE